MKDEEKLHASLREFYNRSEEYFEEAGEANAELTPERAHLFSFVPDGALVVDVGSGRCENAEFLRGRVRYVACDLSEVGLLRARGLKRPISAFVQAESQALPFRESSVDVVMSTYALEHFVYPEKCLREMWRVCRRGGRIILISPAYDHPMHVPPSVGHWTTTRRWGLIARQFSRQVSRHLNPGKKYFAQIMQPRVLGGEYQPDFDAVHLVSTREVSNLFRELGAQFLFERKRVARPGAGPREAVRNLFLRAGIGEYAGLNLQLVLQKP